MGTRATLSVYNDSNCIEQLTQVFRSMDGYPTYAGRLLFNALKGVRLTNGYFGYSKNERREWANGMGHLAATATGVWLEGGANLCYVLHPKVWEIGSEWSYVLYPASDPLKASQRDGGVAIRLRVSSYGKELWDGELSAFDETVRQQVENRDDD